MKLFKKDKMLQDIQDNHSYVYDANQKFNGLVLEYNNEGIWIDEITDPNNQICELGDILVSINNIDVDEKNLVKVLKKFKYKNKKMKFMKAF